MGNTQQIRENFHSALKKHRLKNTKQRNSVLDVLLENDDLSNSEIANKLSGIVDRATVYRIVDLYEKMNLVNRIWTGWKSKIELSDRFVAHHHHATCKRCNRSFRVESEELESVISHLANELKFNMTSHTMEIGGICKNCV